MSIHLGLRDQNPEQSASERDVEQLASFLTYLEQRGHRVGTAQAYQRAVSHFLHWRHTLPPDDGPVFCADQMRAFLNEHIPTCRCPGRVVRSQTMLRAALNQFLLMDGQPRLQPSPPPTSTAIANQLRDFDHYLQAVCGLAEQTRRSRCRLIAQFLARVFGSGPVEVARLTPAVLVDTIITWAQDAPPSTASAMVGALRSYLRCLCFQGLLRDNLAATLPAPACWPLTSVPPALSAAELAQFWSAFDRTTPIGQRDYAMARCLADLGLRCHEVADV
jgi:site-specific recombinase XerD